MTFSPGAFSLLAVSIAFSSLLFGVVIAAFVT
jgi:hypothetical protein